MSSAIDRHLETTTMLSFVAGTLPEALCAVVAAHLSMCPRCAREMPTMERIGAALLDAAPVAGGASVVEPPDWPVSDISVNPVARLARLPADKLPGPIAHRYDLTFDTIAWKRLGPGVWHCPLPLSPGIAGDLRLLRIAPGSRMPEHGHGGAELTLVLDGAYGDETGTFRRGDVQDVDDEIQHQPVADTHMGCICLIASEHPARFKSLVARLVQPWTGM